MKKLTLILSGLMVLGTAIYAADSAETYKKCAGCHGKHGEKKALGKSEVINTMDRDSLVEAMKGYKDGTLNKYGMGMLMRGQVADMSDDDIEKMADYITTLKEGE